MAVKASAAITLSTIRDISSVTWYYQLKAGTTAPDKPTVSPPPSPWSTAEPSYTAGDTKYLFTCERTVYTDGTFEYTDPSLSSSYEAAKVAYNKASNAESAATDARKYATNYMTDVSNGVYVHAEGTPTNPTSGTAKGVRITDQVDVIRNGTSISQFGENVILGEETSNHLMIGNNSYGYYVEDVPISTITCDYDLDEDEDVGSKTMELKVVDPNYSVGYDKERSGLTLHYENESGGETYARLFVENDNYATNVSFIAELVPTRPRLILRNASAYFIVYARGSIASERVATFNGSMLISGNAGMIQMFGGSTAPRGWVLCNGQALNRTTYADLYAVIGTTYGAGDGSTTFNVPDLRGRAPIGAGAGSGLTSRTLGDTTGAETVKLTAAQSGVPAHSHPASGDNYFLTAPDTTNADAGAAISGSGYYYPRSAVTGWAHPRNTASNTAANASSAHNNMQPSAVVNFIICTGRIVV